MSTLKSVPLTFLIIACMVFGLTYTSVSASSVETIVPISDAKKAVKQHIEGIEPSNVYYKSWGNVKIELEHIRDLYD